MALEIKKLATDERKEAEGVWQPAGDDCRIKVARFGNPKSTRLFTKLTKPYRRQIDNGTMDPKKQVEILARVMADSILLDWENMTEDGEPVEYSPENAYRLLKEYRELRELVEDYAKDAESFRQEQLEEAEGN